MKAESLSVLLTIISMAAALACADGLVNNGTKLRGWDSSCRNHRSVCLVPKLSSKGSITPFLHKSGYYDNFPTNLSKIS
jgi:hypothetical protein